MEKVFEFCSGQNCPLKQDCLRYKENINKRKEYHLAWPPYDATKNKCGKFVGKHGENLINQAILNVDKSADSN